MKNTQHQYQEIARVHLRDEILQPAGAYFARVKVIAWASIWNIHELQYSWRLMLRSGDAIRCEERQGPDPRSVLCGPQHTQQQRRGLHG